MTYLILPLTSVSPRISIYQLPIFPQLVYFRSSTAARDHSSITDRRAISRLLLRRYPGVMGRRLTRMMLAHLLPDPRASGRCLQNACARHTPTRVHLRPGSIVRARTYTGDVYRKIRLGDRCYRLEIYAMRRALAPLFLKPTFLLASPIRN